SLTQLTDAAVWRPLLARYAAATSLATALTDADGRTLTQTESRPTWGLLREAAPVRDGNCPFCLRPTAFRLCVERLTNGMTLKQDWGLVHFAIPLAIDGQSLAVIFAGQVFTGQPDRLVLKQAAKQLGIPPNRLLQTARDEMPFSTGNLEVCRSLLDA